MAYDRVLIRDLGSRNGVRVNGRLLEEARLQAGDELAIGPILFRLEQEDEDVPGPRSAPARPGAVSSFGKPAGIKPGQKPRPSRSPAPDSDVDLVPLDDI